jgi:MFS family permease
MSRSSALLPIAFAVFGLHWGAWQAVLPDLAAAYGLSTGPLGAILTLGFAVSLPAMLGTGRLVDRLGAGWGMAIPGTIMALGVLAVALQGPIALLIVGVVAMAAGSGSYDVAINGAGMADSGWSRPARMTFLHAAFSGGGMVGAIAGGMAIGAGIAPAAVYGIVAAALLVVAAVLSRSHPPAGSADRTSVPGSLARVMVPLAVVAALAFLAEGSMETWSALYLRDELGAAAFIGALGPAAFHAAMLAGRLIGVGVAGALGASRTLLVAGGMTVLGMVVALGVPTPALAIPGMALSALGAAFIVPVVVSLAAERAGGQAGRAASYVLTLGYAGFLVGPSLVGVLGELAGLRVALAVVPLAGLVVALASHRPSVGGARDDRPT